MWRESRKACRTAVVALLAIFSVNCGGGGGPISPPPPPTISISISPQTATVFVGGSTQFAATVTGSSSQSVTWSVNDVAGGNATAGTISATGLYTAPAVPPSPNAVTVKAASAADSTKTASASVTITNPVPALNSISPSTVIAGSGDTTLTLTGTGFAQQSTVTLSGTSLTTKFESSTQLTAAIPSAQLANAGVFPVTVVTPSPGGGTSNAVDFTVLNPAPQINSISPSTVNAGSGETTLVVSGSGFAIQSVVQANGSALVTTFVSSSKLTATVPAAMLANVGALTITVKTPSPGGGTSAAANLQVVAAVSVSPAAATVITGQSQQFAAKVSGISSQKVTWSIDGAGTGNSTVGTVSSTGLYTTPAVVPNPSTVTLRATSDIDNTLSGTAVVTIASPVEDWPKYRRDLANTGRSAETGISSANIGLFALKWKFNTSTLVSASPAVATVNTPAGPVRNVYVGNWNGAFFAINADTGQKGWSFHIDKVSGCSNSATINTTIIGSSAAVVDGVVYFGAANGYVYALDAATGSLVWKVQLGDPCQGYFIWSSPAVSNGMVYFGVASFNDTPCVPGQMVALTAGATGGTRLWTFDAIDQSTCPTGTCVGAGIWASPAIDTASSILYIGTGNPATACASPSNPAMAGIQYPDSLIALDLATGALKSSYRVVSYDIDDLDFGSSPVLHATQETNQCTGLSLSSSWVTEANKNSVVYSFRRGSSGTVGAPMQVNVNSGTLLASPALIPSTTSQNCGNGTQQVIDQGNELFFPTPYGHLFDVTQPGNGTSPSIKWDLIVNPSSFCATRGNCLLYSAPAAVTDLVIFGGGDGSVYVVTTAGDIVKSFGTGTSQKIPSGPAISHSQIFFGAYDGYVYCYSLNGQ